MPANPSAFVAHAREVLAKATPGPLKTRDDVGVFDECGRFVADHGDVWGANLHVLAVNSLAALCDVVEAAARYEHAQRTYSVEAHGDFLESEAALLSALARLEVPE